MSQDDNNDDSDQDWVSSKESESESEEDMDFEEENEKRRLSGPSAHELAAVWLTYIVFMRFFGFLGGGGGSY